MKHLNDALEGFSEKEQDYIKVAGNSVVFQIQNGPIKEVGVNGVQATDMLQFNRELFVSLNNSFPSPENEQTILKLDEALQHQYDRTKDREDRGVEGKNLA